MNEYQRMQYLDAMSIEQFVPRKLLANSAALRLCELPVSQHVVETEVTEVFEEERVLPQAAEVVNRLLDTEARTLKTTPEPLQKNVLPEQADVDTPVEPQEVRFSLAVWQLQNGVLILDSHEPRAALPTEKLLANVLLAGKLLDLNLPKMGRLSWPINPELPVQGGWQAAREYFEAYLDAAHQKLAITQIIAFGEEALKALIDKSDAEYMQFGQGFALPHLSARGLYFPSLATLLRHPEYKTIVWRGLLRAGATLA